MTVWEVITATITTDIVWFVIFAKAAGLKAKERMRGAEGNMSVDSDESKIDKKYTGIARR